METRFPIMVNPFDFPEKCLFMYFDYHVKIHTTAKKRSHVHYISYTRHRKLYIDKNIFKL
jgi:hypothetical protein